MRKYPRRVAGLAAAPAFFCALVLLLSAVLVAQSTSISPTYDTLAAAQLQRAENEVAKVKALVEQGTLPEVQLTAAKIRLADAQDEVTLSKTLYGQGRLQDLTQEQADAMLAAASHRVERQAQIVEDRQKLVASGVIAHSELAAIEGELESRKRVRDLAENRVKLLEDLRQMVEAEQRVHSAPSQTNGSLQTAMMRYDGNGLFTLNDLPTIANEFERKFHRTLPVSALGQTLLHQSMGLDHRNRVDIALNPDAAEGIWLRQLLEHLKIPYLAFHSAVAGAATAPHIHIGPGSTKLTLAKR